MASGGLDALCLANAETALNAGDIEGAIDWLNALSKTAAKPARLVARCADAASRLAQAAGNWPAAVAEAVKACNADRTAWRQERLGLLRSRRDSLNSEQLHAIAAVTPPPTRLRADSLQPEVGAVHACGSYYSRGRHRQAPWSKYLRLSKEPPFDDEERRAAFRIASAYYTAYILTATDLLRRAEVVVPVPANPERYRRRLASLPDELAAGCQAILALKDIPFALNWAAEFVNVEMKRLEHRERRRLAPSMFVPGPDAHRIAGRGVLLVDDLTTSGSTLRACAGVLRELGASSVDACTLAHTEG